MGAPLTAFEAEILDKIIPTQTLGNPPGLKMAIRNLVVAQREQLQSAGMSDQEFGLLLSHTGNNIFQFLRDNEFYYEREGSVFYLTEKGKQLRVQGTLEKYVAWREVQRAKNLSDMHQIQTKGYVTENQPKIEKEEEKKKKRFGFFTL